MEKKRSKGVTIFGWLFIFSGVSGLFSFTKSQAVFPYFIFSGFAVTLFAFILNGASIIAGINILRLKEWARKLVITLAILFIIYRIIFSTFSFLLTQKASPAEVIQLIHRWLIIFSIIITTYFSLVLFFFTRPQVKAQFSPERVGVVKENKWIVLAMVALIIFYNVGFELYRLVSDWLFILNSNKIIKEVGEKNVITGLWFADQPYKLKLKIKREGNEISVEEYAQVGGDIPLTPQFKTKVAFKDDKASFERETGFSIESWEIQLLDKELRVEIFRHFTDKSGRKDSASTYVLERKKRLSLKDYF